MKTNNFYQKQNKILYFKNKTINENYNKVLVCKEFYFYLLFIVEHQLKWHYRKIQWNVYEQNSVCLILVCKICRLRRFFMLCKNNRRLILSNTLRDNVRQALRKLLSTVRATVAHTNARVDGGFFIFCSFFTLYSAIRYSV